MSKVIYEPKSDGKVRNHSELYHVDSLFFDQDLLAPFRKVKANVCDLNPALVTKCITGTEQDFLMLMNRAKDFVRSSLSELSEEAQQKVLEMFRECVFGYYVVTPLVTSSEVSDLKIYDWNHITVKAHGKRYVSDISFADPEDYKKWFERIQRIQELGRTDLDALSYCTDRLGADAFYLRIDVETEAVMSTDVDVIHIRKMPKEKLTWEYLMSQDMLDGDLYDYLLDRILSGYGFLISGRGGSGKSTLLNNMLDLIPFDESVLVSQESDELYSDLHPQIQFEHTLTVHTEEETVEFKLEDELRLGLLQDIDNFVIGEIKGGEALHVFTTALSTGARFFGTIHSNDARSSVIRLAQCARYISDYPMDTLLEMLTAVPFVLIHMSNFSIDEIVEIEGWDEKEKKLLFAQVYRKERA